MIQATTIKNSFSFVFLFFAGSIQAEIPLYVLHSKQENNPYACLFAHGLWMNHNHAWMYSTDQDWGMFDHTIVSFDFPDGQNGFNRNKVNLGQQADIERLSEAHQKMKRKNPHLDKTILCGVSRGAATIINYVGTTQDSLDDVEAIILECPFDSLQTVLDNLIIQYKLWWVPRAKRLVNGAVKKLYQKYNHNGIHPIDVIKNFPKNIPVILTHSKKDWLIPIDATRRLYLALKEQGHPHLYLLETPEGDHGETLWQKSGALYRNTIHAIFEKLGISHNARWAKYGKKNLKDCQPSWLEVYNRIAKN